VTSPAAWDEIAEELLAMAQEDGRVRAQLAADGSLFGGYNPVMRAVHDRNAARLQAIIEAHGWPGERQVGKEAAEAAWQIAQHAIAQPEFQRRVLILLQQAVQEGNAPTLQAAMMEDRIRCFEGRPQRYGTQFDWDAEGRMSPLPIDDPDQVDIRRREIGLEPLALQVHRHRAAMADDAEQPPEDWAARQREMDAWCREVGWRV
jgi:hypothetical protein